MKKAKIILILLLVVLVTSTVQAHPLAAQHAIYTWADILWTSYLYYRYG